jgi:hypothetical protein
MRIRLLGPVLGMVPMAVLGAVSWLSLRMGDGRTSGLLALVAGVSAAPGLLFVGAPFADDANYPMAILASMPLWLVLGLIASRRATRTTVASWRDFWREMTYLTVAVVIGAIVALAAATKILDESLVEWQLARI